MRNTNWSKSLEKFNSQIKKKKNFILECQQDLLRERKYLI